MVIPYIIEYDKSRDTFSLYHPDDFSPAPIPILKLKASEALELSRYIESILSDPNHGQIMVYAKERVSQNPEYFIRNIKDVRDRYPMGLKEAKEIVEQAYIQLGILNPNERNKQIRGW